MRRSCDPSGSVAALPEGVSGALQGHRTADIGDRAISMSKCITAPQPPSSWKAHVMDLLSEVCERAPAWASAWADAIQGRFAWVWRV
jgi:hypothetical protein